MPDGPWTKYAAPQGPWTKYAGQSPAPTLPGNPTDTMRPLSTMEQLTQIHPITSQMSPADKAETFVSNIGAGGYGVLLHPLDTAKGIASSLLHPLDTLKATYDAANTRPMETLSSAIGQSGAVAPVAELASSGLRKLPGIARGTIAGDVNKPITPGGITPAERYNSARSLGVKLDAADATNSGVLKAVKKVNENSLLGSDIYDKARTANTAALTDSTGKILDSVYKGDRESGGRTVQRGLQRDQQGLQAAATAGFDNLPQDIPLPGLEDVGKQAQDLAKSNAAYQDLFPSLRPNKAMSVVGDVGGLGPQPPAPIKLSPFVDESGTPIPSAIQAPKPAPKSFSVGQKLRSDLLEFRRKNPDIVAGQGDAMVGQLAGGVDDALTGGSSQLTPSQLATFRDANAKWADMKATYDDPSNPLYHAVRTDNPSQLYSGIGPKTPEMVRNLEERLGKSIAPIRRGTIEGALKSTSDGSLNFKNFGTQLNRIPADYRASLFTPEQQEMLGHVQNVSNLLGQDANPSGSAKLGQKITEAGMLGTAVVGHPTGLLPLAQYPAARLMNSPALVDWMMQPGTPSPAIPVVPLRAAATAGVASKKR